MPRALTSVCPSMRADGQRLAGFWKPRLLAVASSLGLALVTCQVLDNHNITNSDQRCHLAYHSKPRSLIDTRMDGWSVAKWGGGSWLCFNHPVVRVICSSAVLTLSLTTPHLLPASFVHRSKRCVAAVTTAGDRWVPNDRRTGTLPTQWRHHAAAFNDCLSARKVLVSG